LAHYVARHTVWNFNEGGMMPDGSRVRAKAKKKSTLKKKEVNPKKDNQAGQTPLR
jgi:hypothetical protein